MRKPWIFAVGFVVGASLAASYFVFVRLQRDEAGPTVVVQAPPPVIVPTPAPTPTPVPSMPEMSAPSSAPPSDAALRPDTVPAASAPGMTKSGPNTPEVLKQDIPAPWPAKSEPAGAVAPKPDVPSTNVASSPPTPAPASAPVSTAAIPPLAAANASAPISALTGLIVPVVGVRPEKLSDTYNDRRGGNRPHEALDIMAPRGTPVVAVADGKVVKLFNSKPGGLTVYQFDPKETVAYYYAHLDRYAAGVTEGLSLKQGEVIGYVGSTGNASPDAPHLHFAIFRLGPEKHWWQGTPVNPFGYLTQH